METYNSLKSSIIQNIATAQRGEIYFKEIYKNQSPKIYENEFLFFIKPEITKPSESINLEKVLDLITLKINQFSLSIENVKILSARYLEDYDIIAKHYGVINTISSNAIKNLSEAAKESFFQVYKKSVNDVKILGGAEFLNQYKHFNEYSLDYLWKNCPNVKLASGTYCEEIKVDNEIIYLMNGFHPRQLKHFTEEGKCIVIMTLAGDISWDKARNNFIGATNPSNAMEGSLRREFLDRRDELGLSEVSQGANGVHLSAGPVEALIELIRYNSNFKEKKELKSLSDYRFGRKLLELFSNNEVEKIISNSFVNYNNKTTSIFDITEEKNTSEASLILQQVFHK
jgi:hypothetical protein